MLGILEKSVTENCRHRLCGISTLPRIWNKGQHFVFWMIIRQRVQQRYRVILVVCWCHVLFLCQRDGVGSLFLAASTRVAQLASSSVRSIGNLQLVLDEQKSLNFAGWLGFVLWIA